MKLVIITQHLENYGVHDENSQDIWKHKGGDEYIVDNYVFVDSEKVKMDAENLGKLVSYKNDAFEVLVIDWSLEDDDYVPYSESIQQELEGQVARYSPRITLEGVVTNKFLDFDIETGKCSYRVVETDFMSEEA